jgi:hypothetical protein
LADIGAAVDKLVSAVNAIVPASEKGEKNLSDFTDTAGQLGKALKGLQGDKGIIESFEALSQKAAAASSQSNSQRNRCWRVSYSHVLGPGSPLCGPASRQGLFRREAGGKFGGSGGRDMCSLNPWLCLSLRARVSRLSGAVEITPAVCSSAQMYSIDG